MRFFPAGPAALLVEVDDVDGVVALMAEVDHRRRQGWSGATDIVPGALTVLFDGIEDPRSLAGELAGWEVPPAPPTPSHVVELACRYDGPDLAAVAAHWGVPAEEAMAIHTSLDHRVAFCGFAPGFAYIAGLGDRWSVPRRTSPRPVVPAGSVAVAGTYSGVYPRPSPGGWQLIGRTEAVLWDLGRDPAALLAPGTAVRFVAR